MTHPKKTQGVWTAIVTPWKQDLSLDTESFTKLVERQINAGVDGVVVAGTTGESPTLPDDEKIRLVELARTIGGSELGVMAGSGSSDTTASIRLSQQCEKAGADRLLVVTPAYSKPNPDGHIGHFGAIQKSVSIPICLYHVPGRTAQKMSAELLAQIIRECGIESVKEASADLSLFADVVKMSNASVLTGDDPTYLASRAIGGKGVVSVVTNIFPEAFCKVQQLTEKGSFSEALQINQCLSEFVADLFIESNPVPTKYVLSRLGLCENTFRLPLAPISNANAERAWASYDATRSNLESLLA